MAMYWYLAEYNELLLDLDNAMRDNGKGPWIEMYFRRRLREAIKALKLQVSSIFLIHSSTPGHYHAIIRLATDIRYYPTQLERLIWQLYLGSDLYRARADLMRFAKGYGQVAPSLLILPHKIPGFYRQPDAYCPCRKKHKLTSKCPTFLNYRGPEMVELFGPLATGKEKMVPLPTGRVPLALIMEVRQ